MVKVQRLLDPIHGLVRFDTTHEEQVVFRLLDCPEFQRLRRIRQLGFSEFVYPGATHTRFAHSIGAFQNSRRLLAVIREKAEFDPERAFATMCAALLHDVGHGPFSHTFEGVEKARGQKKRHEEWTAEIILGDTGVNSVLREVDETFPNEVASIISSTEGGDIYASVVSSQFDADRLDYLKRDRYMTGIGSGNFDFEWLLDCLEVGKATIGHERDFEEVPVFYLNSKGYKTAEAYLQARFQLYSMVYMHKTTRAAEKMLARSLSSFAEFLKEREPDQLDIPNTDPLAIYFRQESPSLGAYLEIDDTAVWTGLKRIAGGNDEALSILASRLLNRKLFKCFDAGARAAPGSQQLMRFRKALRDRAKTLGLTWDYSILEDEPKIEGYHWYDWDEENALKKVLVNVSEQNENIQDIAASSRIVEALSREEIYRVYVPDNESKEKVAAVWKEIVR